MNNIEYHTLSNGLRIVHRQSHSAVEYCGVAINVGSRDENEHEYGLAHFVEHTIFKGTQKRRSCHIINRMESVGGELNAYTTKEETMLYSIFPFGNLARAVELIADLVTSSNFPKSEIDKEREVVAEEINSYLDTPSEAVFDDFEDLIFKNSSLGHNILGNVDSISTFTSQICSDYLTRNYVPSRMVFFYMGAMPPDKTFRIVEKYFNSMPNKQSSIMRIKPKSVDIFNISKSINCHQSHSIIGTRLPSMHTELRYPIALLTNMLGGPGMNSILNIALRERRGLVYTVDASSSLLTDTGLFTIYFGCDTSDTEKCRKLIFNELDNLCSNEISPIKLEKIKKQHLGQILVASDNREQMALSTARATLYFNKVASSEEIAERIMSVTSSQLAEAAQLIAPQNCSTFTLY